jgi:hypothetical protein
MLKIRYRNAITPHLFLRTSGEAEKYLKHKNSSLKDNLAEREGKPQSKQGTAWQGANSET